MKIANAKKYYFILAQFLQIILDRLLILYPVFHGAAGIWVCPG